ncbi:MAG: heavy metal translocating P-type ATPase [Clostridia bacterium]|nr:heavy metal translocating P-type ATPase [Clostridia bacterium]
MKEKFDILGMTCSSCSSHVERAVRKLSGVKNVSVNLLSNYMLVEYDEKRVNTKDIIKSVEDAGYGASVQNDKRVKKAKKSVEENIKSMKKRLIISICFLIPLMYLAMYHMFHEWFGLPIPQFMTNFFHGSKNAITFSLSQFLLLLPILYVNRNYFISGFKKLFHGSPNMDSLIALGSGAATIYGIFAIYMIGIGLGNHNIELVEKYRMDIYFESAGTILTLITLGKYLEAKSKSKTNSAIEKLINLAPKNAILIRNGKEIEVEVKDILVGDIILIKPGSNIPVDGVLTEGSSSIDESAITGESIPVDKSVGDNVISGTINQNGYFKMKAVRVGDDTTLSQIIKLVEEAGSSKAPISKLADKVSAIFVPAVILIAISSTIIWLLLGQSFEFALTTGIAVLVISCPCALGLATPVAIMVGTGKAAENGILIKSAESLEMLHQVDAILLDKTGTITEGKLRVEDIFTTMDQEEFLRISGSLEKNSEHPLSNAILKKIKEEKISLSQVDDFEVIPGRGVKGKIDGICYYGGNIKWMNENNITIDDSIMRKSNSNTLLYFSNEKSLIGIIAVSDTIKDTSKYAVEKLMEMGIDVYMITGDNSAVANSIGKKVGIKNIISEVLPQNKEEEVRKLQNKGKKVAFVGDGINDSPALVSSDVGIAIGNGTDIAIESADVILVKNTLLDVVTGIHLSKAVIRNIKMNLFWAFIYNIIGIPIAAGVFYFSFGLKLNPMIGAAAMSLSSVCVVTNALRLKRFKTNFKEEKNVMMENQKEIYIDGMQCNHCKMSVEKALGSLEFVERVEVSLEDKKAIISYKKDVDNEKIVKAIEDAGFVVKDIK